MRISDWSSDVCSSDLGIETSPRPEAGDPFGGAKQYSLRPGAELEHQDYRARPGFGEYAREHQQTVADARISHLARQISDHRVRADAQRLGQLALDALQRRRKTDLEIGRACCRERGCQYV